MTVKKAIRNPKRDTQNSAHSISPNGESFPLPRPAAPGHSWARFFRNQDKLTEIRIQPDLKEALKGADAVVLAVRHQAYLKLDPGKVIKMTGRPVAIIDCFGILNDAQIRRYFELGCEVKGLGRGHVKRIKDDTYAKR